MKKNPFVWHAAILITLVAIASTVIYLWLGINWDEKRTDGILVAEAVDRSVMNELSEALTVAQVMSGDANLKNMLHNEWKNTEEEMEDKMKDYLDPIQKQFGFDTVYVVAEKSKRYYTYLGMNKVMDPEHDSYDMWYSDFKEDGDAYRVECNKDQWNRDQLTIFVYNRLDSEIGRFLGVAGVGIQADKIMRILESYEEEYKIRIDYVTSDGLIQMSSEADAVHSSHVTGVELPDPYKQTFVYDTVEIGGFSVVKYVPELDWYLVVQSDSGRAGTVYNFRFFFAEAAILIAVLAFLFLLSRSMQIETSFNGHHNPNVDDLTGLPNREYFIQIYGEKGTIRTIQFQSIAEFSIDDFEMITNPALADRLVLAVLRTARETFGERGQIMRWNKSSFIVLLEMAEEEADTICRQFVRAVEETGEVTVSVGLTKIDLNSTLKRDYYRAVQNLYLVKELGGNNVKRG
jgi:GGDEF domain-containing protein